MTAARATDRRECRVDEQMVADLAEVLGDDDPPRPGDRLPALWHWAALSTWAPLTSLGADGHHAERPFSGHEKFSRRMFAGGRVRIAEPTTVGQQVTVTESAGPPRVKRGRSGEFVLVTVTRSVRSLQDQLCIEEEQDLVYRPPIDSLDAPGESAPAAALPLVGTALARIDGSAEWQLRTDPVLLMRFSALTRNTHRIHFDGEHAAAEGHAAPVVHGPLQAIVLAEVHRRTHPKLIVRTLSHRGTTPLLCGVPATIHRAEGSSAYRLQDQCSGVTFSTLDVQGDHHA